MAYLLAWTVTDACLIEAGWKGGGGGEEGVKIHGSNHWNVTPCYYKEFVYSTLVLQILGKTNTTKHCCCEHPHTPTHIHTTPSHTMYTDTQMQTHTHTHTHTHTYTHIHTHTHTHTHTHFPACMKPHGRTLEKLLHMVNVLITTCQVEKRSSLHQ